MSPRGSRVRPTSDRVRESYFNIIGQYFKDILVLDLYCGSGAVGFEFLSRGAKKIVFVDNSPESISLVKKNASMLNLNNRCEFFTMSASDFIFSKRIHGFDYIFIDPPYKENIQNSILKYIDIEILKTNGILTVEHSKRVIYPDRIGNLFLYRQKRFGDTVLSFYSFNPYIYEEKL